LEFPVFVPDLLDEGRQIPIDVTPIRLERRQFGTGAGYLASAAGAAHKGKKLGYIFKALIHAVPRYRITDALH
jgi:hypothetical protein